MLAFCVHTLALPVLLPLRWHTSPCSNMTAARIGAVQKDLERELAARGLDPRGLRADLEARMFAVLDQEAARAAQGSGVAAAYDEEPPGADSVPAQQPTAVTEEVLQTTLPEDLNWLSKPQVRAGQCLPVFACLSPATARPLPCHLEACVGRTEAC